MYGQPWGDYTLYSTKNSNKGYLIDMSGNPYHTWTFASNAPTGYTTYLLPGGTLLRTVARAGNYFTGGPICGEVQKVDWNGTVTWDFVYSTPEYCSHHDICPMPNGNVLLICYETKTPAQATQAGSMQAITIWPDKIVEIEPSGTTGGTVVWEWKAWDHLCQNADPSKDNYVTSIVMHPELLNINYHTQKDWMHVNGIDYNPTLDQVVFSSHALNEFYVIDHSTTTAEAASHSGGNSGKGGDFLYRWGNPSAYEASGTTNFNVVHDAHWIPSDCPKAGYISGFNNKGGPGNKSCVDLVNPPYNGYNYSITPGSAFLPATYDWRTVYSGSATPDEGTAQQLPNGNTLITISFSSFMYEIDSNQTQVWSKTVSQPVSNAFRYAACYVNGPLIVDAAADPASICEGSTTQLNANASGGTGITYSWTSNPPGFTSSEQNPVVSPVTTTTYFVTVTSQVCNASDSITVTVNPLPSAPSITQNSDMLVSSSSTGNQWYVDGSIIPGATGQSYIPQQNGTYQVSFTDQYNCTSPLSDPFDVNWVSIENISSTDELKIFPNPASGICTITGIPVNSRFTIRITTSAGNPMLEVDNMSRINVSSLENGLYLLTIWMENEPSVTKKLLIIH